VLAFASALSAGVENLGQQAVGRVPVGDDGQLAFELSSRHLGDLLVGSGHFRQHLHQRSDVVAVVAVALELRVDAAVGDGRHGFALDQQHALGDGDRLGLLGGQGRLGRRQHEVLVHVDQGCP
jgi:hypothetical protein